MNKIEQTRQALLKAGRKIFNLSSGNPNEFGIFFPRHILEQAYQRFLDAPAYEPDPKGDIKAREAVRDFYAKRELKISPGQIMLTSGTSESYFHLFKMLARPGEKILFPRPSYPLFEEIARLAEVELSFYKLDEDDGWQIDCENLESKIRPDVKAIVLISPSNPTGAVLHKDTLQKVAAIAAKYDLPIISDEVFSEYVFDDKPFAGSTKKISPGKKTTFPRIAALAKKVTVFTLNGISKTYALPGLKLSWVVVTGPKRKNYLEELERSADAFLSCGQVPQAMLPEIIKKGDAFIRSFRRRLQTNRDLAVKVLGQNGTIKTGKPQIAFHQPEGGFYLFARLDIAQKTSKNARPITDEDFVISFMEKTGIFAHPGYFYDYDKGIHILISLLPPQKTLEKNLKKIIRAL